LIESIIPQTKGSSNQKNGEEENPILKNLSLKEQVRQVIEMPDEEYSDKVLTSQLRQYISAAEKQYYKTISDYKSHMAPSFWETNSTYFNVAGLLGKSYYVHSYPSYIDALRTREIFSFDTKRDMSFIIYPKDDAAIQSMLKQKATQLKAEISESIRKGITLDTEIEQQYRDVEDIRQKLTTREERYFEL
jgi:hypothetical protein